MRPWIEGLEDRVVLSMITWDSTNHPTGGSWDVAGNWLGGVKPGAGDDAVINLTAANTVTLNGSVTDTVNSLTTNGNTSISIGGDVLSLASASTIGGGLTLTTGTLTGAGTLTVTGGFAWSGGAMTGTGATVLDGASALGATGNTNYSELLSGRTLNNFGSATLTDNPNYGGGLALSGVATLDNEAGATFAFLTDVGIGFGNASGTLANQGTLSKTGGTGSSTISVPITDTGAISAASGTLNFQGGGTLSGTGALSSAANSQVNFGGGTYTLSDGTARTGTGTVSLTGGTLSVPSGAASITAAFSFGGGTLNGAGTLTLAGGLNWTGGTMSGSGTTALDGASTLGTAGLATSYEYLAGRTLNNFGTATVAFNPSYGGSGLQLSAGAVLDNEAGATLSFVSDTDIAASGVGPGSFVNAGTLTKAAGTGTSAIAVPITDTGVISAATGTLSLQGATSTFSAAAMASAAANATLAFDTGTADLAGGATLSGAGTVALRGGTVSVDGSVSDSATTTALTGGTLTGAGTLTVTGGFTWTGGTMSGSGTTALDGASTLGTAGLATSYEYLAGRTLDNFGTATVAFNPSYGGSGLQLSGGAVLDNEVGATLSFLTDTDIAASGVGPGSFVNAGTLTKAAGTGTSAIAVPITDTGVISAATGTLSLQGATSTFSAAAMASAAANATLAFDTGTADLAGGATLSGAGTVALRGGTVSVDGSVSDSATTTALTGGTLTGAGTLTVTGGFTWTGGTMSGSGTTALDGASTLGTAGLATSYEYLAGRTLDNFGTATETINPNYGGYGLQLSGGAVLDNEVGATLSFLTDIGIAASGSNPGSFVNAGTLTKAAGTGTSAIAVPITDTGAISAATGTLNFQGGGTLSGTGALSSATNSQVNFGGGTFTLSDGTARTGTGTVSLTGGTLSVPVGAASISAALSFSGGTISGAGTVTVTGGFAWTGGTMSGSGTTALDGASTLGTAGVGTSYEYLAGRTLNNFGTATVAFNPNYGGSGLQLSGGAVLDNEAGATLSFVSDTDIAASGSNPGMLVNAGTLSKTAGTGTSTINVTLNNSGVVQAASGTLSLQGTFSNFSSATNTLTGGSYVVSATLQFTNANIVTNAASITLTGAASKIIDNSNNDALGNFATNAAAGSFTIQTGRNLTTPGAFTNAGSLTVGASSTFTATGAYTQSVGSTNLVGGGILASTTSNVTINGGILGGSGTVASNLNNTSGSVDPGGAGTVGVLGVSGNYTQGTGGTLNIDVASTTQYDVLTVAGTATLAGTLQTVPISGYAPANYDSFQILTFASSTGTFAPVYLTGLRPYLNFSTNYNPSNVTIGIGAATLAVTSFAPTTTGFTATFDEPFNISLINLYDTAAAGFGPADVTVVGANTGPVAGSLIVTPGNLAMTFVATNRVLAPDTYTVTFRSASNGFTDTSGGLLDGNGDGTPGDDYTTTFTVAPSSAVIVAVPDFARGPGQAVVIPAANGSGLPLTISDGTSVTSISLTLTYNPSLLSITGANLGASAPAGSSVSVDTSTPGLAVLTFTSPTALPAGPGTFATLVASVPNAASYASKEALVLSNISLNNGAIPATDQDGVHVVAYLGDTTGNGGYSSFDATLLRQVVANISTGFAAYPLLDPRIVGDIAGFGTLSGIDATYITQYVANIPQPRIPALPGVTIVAGGPDPLIWLPQDLTATPGSTLTVPVLFRQTNGSAIGLDAADLAIEFDPGLFVITGIRLGGLTGGFTLTESYDNATGEIIASERSTSGALQLTPGTQGALLYIDLMVRPGADLGASRLNLLGEGRVGSAVVYTSLNDGGLTLVPAPTDSDLDPVDGMITVTPPPAPSPAPAGPALDPGSKVASAGPAAAIDLAIEASHGDAIPPHPPGISAGLESPEVDDPALGVLIPWTPAPEEPVVDVSRKKVGVGRVLLGSATPGRWDGSPSRLM